MSESVKFFDKMEPSLKAGRYVLESTQDLNYESGQQTFSVQHSFNVEGAQFSIPHEMIAATFPPPGHGGAFEDYLPHITIAAKTLPWSRKFVLNGTPYPWMYLAVLEESEMVQIQTNSEEGSLAERVENTQVDQLYLQKDEYVLPDLGGIQNLDTPCQVVTVTGETLKKILPELNTLHLLCHVRQSSFEGGFSDANDKPNWYTTLFSPRFPEGGEEGKHYHALLLSLEGWDQILEKPGKIRNDQLYRFISLYHWGFQSKSSLNETFQGLTARLLQRDGTNQQSSGALFKPNFLLRYPITEKTDPELGKKLDEGYVPLPSVTYSSEKTFAWYRGPFVPAVPRSLANLNWPNSSAAMIYDKPSGVFNQSYAVAWQLGRALALANKQIALNLLKLRKQYHTELTRRIKRPNLSALKDRIGISLNLEGEDRVDQVVHRAIESDFLAEIHSDIENMPLGTSRDETTEQQMTMQSKDDHISKLQECYRTASDAMQSTDVSSTSVDALRVKEITKQSKQQVKGKNEQVIQELKRWLNDLIWFEGVPFHYLVPMETMLPVDGLRFFYIDPNWQHALVEGAISAAIHSSKDTETNISFLRKELCKDHSKLYSGMLIRSSLISGWPMLTVEASKISPDNKKEQIRNQKLIRLSANVLLVIFKGVPDEIAIREPETDSRYGQTDGLIFIRSTETTGEVKFGTQLEPFPKTRQGGFKGTFGDNGKLTGMLDLKRLKADLESALNSHQKETMLSPATLALQLSKKPQQVILKRADYE